LSNTKQNLEYNLYVRYTEAPSPQHRSRRLYEYEYQDGGMRFYVGSNELNDHVVFTLAYCVRKGICVCHA
jgi:hypothetical protein